jgi:hypothetical protein
MADFNSIRPIALSELPFANPDAWTPIELEEHFTYEVESPTTPTKVSL